MIPLLQFQRTATVCIRFVSFERRFHAPPLLACWSLFYQRRESGEGASASSEPACAGGSSSAGAGRRSSRANASVGEGEGEKISKKPSKGDSAVPCSTPAAEGNDDEPVCSGYKRRGCQYDFLLSICAEHAVRVGLYLSKQFFFSKTIDSGNYGTLFTTKFLHAKKPHLVRYGTIHVIFGILYSRGLMYYTAQHVLGSASERMFVICNICWTRQPGMYWNSQYILHTLAKDVSYPRFDDDVLHTPAEDIVYRIHGVYCTPQPEVY